MQTKQGVRDLSHFGSKGRQAAKLRAEAEDLEQRAREFDQIAARRLRTAHIAADQADALKKQAAEKWREADALCRR